MIHVAELYTRLRTHAPHAWAMSLLGRSVVVYSRQEGLTTAACRSLSVWATRLARGSAPDDVCVVERISRSGFRKESLGQPSRSYHHPNMGVFQAYEMADGSAVAQAGRGIILFSQTGEMVWLIEDGLLVEVPNQWPNLTDLAIVVTAEVLRRAGGFLAHAGGVGRNGRCLLLAGESGSGKTTFTVGKVLEGWEFYGDDMVMIGRTADGVWRAHPFWRPVHLTPDSLQLLDGLERPAASHMANQKLQCSITDLAAVTPPEPGWINAVFCLQPGWEPRTPLPLSKAEALAGLGGTLLSGFVPRNAELDIDHLLDFLTAIPVYQASWSIASENLERFFDDMNVYADQR